MANNDLNIKPAEQEELEVMPVGQEVKEEELTEEDLLNVSGGRDCPPIVVF